MQSSRSAFSTGAPGLAGRGLARIATVLLLTLQGMNVHQAAAGFSIPGAEIATILAGLGNSALRCNFQRQKLEHGTARFKAEHSGRSTS